MMTYDLASEPMRAYYSQLANSIPVTPTRAEQVRRLIRDMGPRYCLHPANRVRRLTEPEIEKPGSRILTEWRDERVRARLAQHCG